MLDLESIQLSQWSQFQIHLANRMDFFAESETGFTVDPKQDSVDWTRRRSVGDARVRHCGCCCSIIAKRDVWRCTELTRTSSLKTTLPRWGSIHVKSSLPHQECWWAAHLLYIPSPWPRLLDLSLWYQTYGYLPSCRAWLPSTCTKVYSVWWQRHVCANNLLAKQGRSQEFHLGGINFN